MRHPSDYLARYTWGVNMREYLPSGQFVLVAGAIALSAALIVFVSWERRTEDGPSTLAVATASLPDTDGDGVKDWEELIRGTDIENPDSDGDGTRDRDEIALGRDPLKPGPDDKMAPVIEGPPDFSLVIDKDTDNLTKTLSQNLFASYIGTYAKDLQADPYTQERVALDVLSKVKVNLRGTVYTPENLVTVSDKSDNYRTFGNEVMRTIGRHRDASFADAAVALAQVVDYGKTEDVEGILAVGGSYRALAEDLADVPLPESLSSSYAAALTALSHTAGAFEDLAAIFDDPVRALAGLQTYQSYLAETTRLFTLIAKELDNKGILFKESEAGFAWKKLRELAP